MGFVMPAGDNAFWADVARAIAPPSGRLVQQAAQTALVDNTPTAITFGAGSEDLDTDNFHDTAVNTSRVTPTIAGWYRVHGAVAFAGQTDGAATEVRIRKNGATSLPPATRVAYSASVLGTTQVLDCEALVSVNGSTDYFEVIAVQDRTGGGTWATAVASQYASTLEWTYVRPL